MQPAGTRKAQQTADPKGLLRWDLAFYLCQSILFALLFFTFQNNIALLLEKRSLGDTAVSERVLAVQSTVGILSGILGRKILSKLGKFSLPWIFLVSSAGMLLILLGRDMILFYAAAAMLGFVFSLRMPAGYLKATSSAAPGQATMATAVYCCSSSLGQFLSPFCVNGAAATLDGKFRISAIALFAVGILSLAFECRKQT